MKSTYKLPGWEWDHKPCPNSSIIIAPFNPCITEIGNSQLALLDSESIHRYASLKKILSASTIKEVEEYLSTELDVCHFYLLIDYIPTFRIRTIDNFFWHRVSQIIEYLDSKFAKVNIMIHIEGERTGTCWNSALTSLLGLFKICDVYLDYLKSKQMEFDRNGFPVLEPNTSLQAWPESIVTFKRRNSEYRGNPNNCVICNYTDDEANYRRLRNVFHDIPELKRYQGVIGMDITVTDDMDIEWQDFTMLLNRLYDAILAANGIKLAFNLRNGSDETLSNLNSIPKNSICAIGTLGCEKTRSKTDFSCISKILRTQSRALIIYGKRDQILEGQLNNIGCPHRQYDDIRKLEMHGSSKNKQT